MDKHSRQTKSYYPVFVDVKAKTCLVVGGGLVAERKVESLLASGAKVKVVSPKLTVKLASWAKKRGILHMARIFEEDDLSGAFLVIAATSEPAINKKIARECAGRGVLVNVVDAPKLSNFIVPSVVDRGDLQISVVTGSPALTRRVREQLEEMFGQEYAVLARKAKQARDEIRHRTSDPTESRQAVVAMVDEQLSKVSGGQAK